MKIAIVGTRGVPANYGGFETCAEELSVALVARGHQVTAYCRYGNAPGNPPEYKGVRLVYAPCLDTKVFGTFTHALMSLVHAVRQPYDVILAFNAAIGPLCWGARLAGHTVAINVDGLEWRRRKWGLAARLYYQAAERICTWAADRIVSDSREIQRYYARRYRAPSTFIAYGAHIGVPERTEILAEYGVEPGGYFFVASRLEPENNADLTVKAFERVETDKKLLIAGGANYESAFIRALKNTRDPRIRFLGPVYEPGHIKELHCSCYAYVHGNEVGGTNPALLKAMAYGNCVLALDAPFNAEVVGDAGVMYAKDPGALAAAMRHVLDHPDQAAEYRRRAVERIRAAYTWDRIVEDYERLFMNLQRRYYRDHPEAD